MWNGSLQNDEFPHFALQPEVVVYDRGNANVKGGGKACGDRHCFEDKQPRLSVAVAISAVPHLRHSLDKGGLFIYQNNAPLVGLPYTGVLKVGKKRCAHQQVLNVVASHELVKQDLI